MLCADSRSVLPIRLTLPQAGEPSKLKDPLKAPAHGLKVVAEGEQPVVE